MKKYLLSSILLIILILPVFSQEIKAISAVEAFKLINRPNVFLIDVRTVAEYVFVGHPKIAYSIPLLFWDSEKMSTSINENFIQDLKHRFKPTDTLIFICRSGSRSLKAAELAIRAAYTRIFNIEDGFEGEKDGQGYRSINGWKNSKLPYTYELDGDLIYPFK